MMYFRINIIFEDKYQIDYYLNFYQPLLIPWEFLAVNTPTFAQLRQLFSVIFFL